MKGIESISIMKFWINPSCFLDISVRRKFKFSKQANQAMELEIFRFVFEIESLHENSVFYAIQSKKLLK